MWATAVDRGVTVPVTQGSEKGPPRALPEYVGEVRERRWWDVSGGSARIHICMGSVNPHRDRSSRR